MDSTVLLGVIQVAVGGTLVQLIIFLLRRRSEIKKLDAEAKATGATGSALLVDSATAYAVRLTERDVELTSRVDKLETKLVAEVDKALAAANVAHEEISRLTQIVSQLRVDLDIANGQVDRLRSELRTAGGRHQL